MDSGSVGMWSVFIFIGLWFSLIYAFQQAKKNGLQVYLGSFFIAAGIVWATASAVLYFNPSHSEILAKAEAAEKQFLILRGGSLDHQRICDAAITAHNLYLKLGDVNKTMDMRLWIVDDKCL